MQAGLMEVPPSASRYSMPAAVAYKEELREKAEVCTPAHFCSSKLGLACCECCHSRKKNYGVFVLSLRVVDTA